MHLQTHLLLGVVCALSTLGWAQAADTLTPQQFSEQFVGKTMVGHTVDGGSVTVRFNPDGSAEIQAGKKHDTGHWHLSDTGYCLTWSRFHGGKERCLTAKRDGDVYQTFVDGKLNAEFRPE